MKGIILAGGKGTRLAPITLAVSKQLMPVYDKPMIYYPLSTLLLAGVDDVLVITNPHERDSFVRLLGDGSEFGIKITYLEQPSPDGLAQAFIIGREFIAGERVALVLGDNIFHGTGLAGTLESAANTQGATIFAQKVVDPSNYGVVEFSEDGRVISMVEKPKQPKSNWVIPGLYFYDSDVCDLSEKLSPSARGELEITDLNNLYLNEQRLQVQKFERGTVWLDTGSFDSLSEASEFVKIIQHKQGLRISSPHEIALRKGFLTVTQLKNVAAKFSNSGYGQYLAKLEI